MFITQSGRTLRNDELTIKDVIEAVARLHVITGYELGFPSAAKMIFHVNPRYVVEWWDA